MELPTTSINNDTATITINNTGGSTRAASRKSRVYVFRQFVIETYGQYITDVVNAREDTRRRSGGTGDDRSKEHKIFYVLDIAGGNGDLSWLLNNVNESMSTSSSTPTQRDLKNVEKSRNDEGLSSSSSASAVSWCIPIQSTVVDPRGKTLNCRHILKSVRYLQQNPEERKRRAIPGLPTHQPLALLIEQGKIRYRLGDTCNSANSNGDNNSSDTNNENGGGAGDAWFVTPEQIPLPLNDEFVNIIQNFQIVEERRGRAREKIQTEGHQKLHISSNEVPVTQQNEDRGDTIKKTNDSDSENCVGKIFDQGDEFQQNPLAFITMDELDKWRNFFHDQQNKIRKIDRNNNDNKRKRSSGDDTSIENDQDVSRTSKPSAINIDDDADRALELILKTDLICGFHPDQATDSCIDLANVLGVPVAVVPCCVFPAEFPDRRVFDSATSEEDGPDDTNKAAGEKVRTYTQLIHYLQQKCPQAKRAELPFSFTETAKNIVLYTFENQNQC